MPEQRKSPHNRIVPRLGVILLAIAPYCLVTFLGASAVAAVSRTTAQVINAKLQAVIQELNKIKRRP